MCWQQLLSHWSQNNKSHQALFKRRPASFRVNCIEEESNVRMESNFKTHSGKALKIAWALGGEETRSHTDFSITLLFPNNIHLSSYNSHFLHVSPLLFCAWTGGISLPWFFNFSLPLSSYMKGAQLKWCSAEDKWIFCHLCTTATPPEHVHSVDTQVKRCVQLFLADHTHTHYLPYHPERGWRKFPPPQMCLFHGKGTQSWILGCPMTQEGSQFFC